MPTFLTTKKMGPELSSRIQASLGGRSNGKPRSTTSPFIVAVLRLLFLVLISSALVSFLLDRKHRSDHLEKTRATLLRSISEQGSSLTKEHKALVSLAHKHLSAVGGDYPGDIISEELKTVGGLEEQFLLSTVYVRGQLGDFKNQAQTTKAVAASLKDSFLVCLLDPPPSDAEKDFLEPVYVAYRAGPLLETATPHFHRLQAAFVVMPLFEESWSRSVKRSKKNAELEIMRKTFERAPLSQGKKAMEATRLLMVLDEDREPGTPAEFDGASKHRVRVTLVDLQTEKTLLRLRLEADPEWISEKRRHRYARGLLGCRLALDVRNAVSPKRADNVTKAEKSPSKVQSSPKSKSKD